MSSQATLDAGLQAVVTAVNKLGTDLTQTLNDIAAKAAAGTNFSAEIATAQGIATSLAAIDAQAVAADPTAPVVSPTPAAPVAGARWKPKP